MTNTEQQQKRAEAVLSSELTAFVSKLIEGAVAAGSKPDTCKFEPKEGVLQIGESQLVVSSLYTLFTEQVSDKAREQFIENVIKTATGKANMPGTLAEAAGLLMPQIYGERKIREKQANLGKAAVLPYHCLNGSDRLLNSGDVGICVVADFGHATVPVLSATLKQWDCDFKDVLQIAVTNLVTKNEKLATSNNGEAKGKGKKGKGKKNKSTCTWEMHPSGCASTTWHDQYDSTRAALFPHILSSRDIGHPTHGQDGDTVCLFGANQQCLVAGGNNPIGLCFMGDMCLDIAKTRDLVSNQPHRLTAVPLAGEKMAAASSSHPLHKLLTTGLEGTGTIYKWGQYDPLAAKGEFSVPEEQGEIDAVLAAVQSGKQIPVFRRDTTTVHNSSSQNTNMAKKVANPNATWVGLKEKGSAFFKQKHYQQAEEVWGQALTAHEQEESNETDQRGALYSNRSAARLAQGSSSHIAGALADAEQAVALRPDWPKGYFRQAKALEAARHYALAADAFTRAAAKTMATSKAVKSREAKEAARLQVQAAEAKACAERHAVMSEGTKLKVSRAKVRQLLIDALGWKEGMKMEGGNTVPGWMPVNVQDTAEARLAATTLYAMLRDRRVTERDRKSEPCSSYCYCYENSLSKDSVECSSPRRPAAPAARTRGVVLRELAEAGGERTMIVMAMGMQAATNADSNSNESSSNAFDTPLEKRSLLQIVESILEVAELKAAAVQFKKLMSEDADCAQLLGDAVTASPATAPTPKAKAAKKVVEKKEPKDPTAVPLQPRKNSKKENDPAQSCCSDHHGAKTAAKKSPSKKSAKPASTTITLDSSTLASLGSNFGQASWTAGASKSSEFIIGAGTAGPGVSSFGASSSSSSWSPFGGSSQNRGLL